METKRARELLLAALVLILAFAIYRAWPRASATSAGAPATSNRKAATSTAARDAARPAAPDVHLEALQADRPRPESAARDLFRFKPKAPPPPAARPPAPPAARPGGAPSASAVPPIPFKFIGIVEAPRGNAKIAVLSDGRGSPVYGREGDIIEGRYRILKIGDESIELAYLDGRGRQTIRLTGS